MPVGAAGGKEESVRQRLECVTDCCRSRRGPRGDQGLERPLAGVVRRRLTLSGYASSAGVPSLSQQGTVRAHLQTSRPSWAASSIRGRPQATRGRRWGVHLSGPRSRAPRPGEEGRSLSARRREIQTRPSARCTTRDRSSEGPTPRSATSGEEAGSDRTDAARSKHCPLDDQGRLERGAKPRAAVLSQRGRSDSGDAWPAGAGSRRKR